jgi:hypothetical protein
VFAFLNEGTRSIGRVLGGRDDSVLHRDGIRGNLAIQKILIPVASLKTGTNVIKFTMSPGSAPFPALMYDYISFHIGDPAKAQAFEVDEDTSSDASMRAVGAAAAVASAMVASAFLL